MRKSQQGVLAQSAGKTAFSEGLESVTFNFAYILLLENNTTCYFMFPADSL